MKRPIPEHLRICFVSKRFPLRGYHTEYGYMWPLFKSLAQRGHDITVITTEDSWRSTQTIENVVIHHIEKSFSQAAGYSFQDAVLERIEELQAEKPFDIIHCADQLVYHLAQFRGELKGALAVDVRATSLDRLFGMIGLTQETVSSYLKSAASIAWGFMRTYWKYDRNVLRQSDGVFVVSEQQRILLERHYFVADSRIHVIPFGVEAPELISINKDISLMKNLGIPEDAQIAVTVSQLDEVGALKNLITAFERVAIKKPNSALVIIGDGPKFFEVEGHALNYALGSKVFFARNVPPEAIKDYINLGDVYINLDSRTSGLEPSILQAMANKKMVIASEVGSNATVIENGVDGYLVHPTVTYAIARLILDAFSGLLDIPTLGANAHQKVIKMFDTQRMVDQTISAYKQILKTARIPAS